MRVVAFVAAVLAVAVFGAAADAKGAYQAPTVPGAAVLLTFQEDPFQSGEMVKSQNDKYASQSWKLAKFDDEGGIEGDQALKAVSPGHQHYGATAVLKKPISVSENQDFVVQYEVRLTEGLECGGAYMKLLDADADIEPEALDADTPYIVMFGPDRCGATNKVHVIIRHQNPKSKEWTEHHLTDAPPIRSDKVTHLYTLVIRKDNTFTVYVDTEDVRSGSLFEDFEPPINPPKEIDDPSDSKPEDWVDEALMPDPEATKPDDWDEDAPATIPDMDAEKPEGWLDDAPDYVDDPEAEKPDDWDDEEDGEWEAPQIPNPACNDAPGCGEWVRPFKTNPEYKGKWTPPMIDNPDYKGVWAPRKIPNPNYFVDEDPHQLPAMSGVAFEIVTNNPGVAFDNILICDDVDAALAFAEKTWRIEHDGIESHAKDLQRAQEKEAREKAFAEGGLIDRVQYYFLEASDKIMENPIPALTTLIAVLASMVFCCCSGGSSAPSNKGPIESDDEDEGDEAEDSKDGEEEGSGKEDDDQEGGDNDEDDDEEEEEEEDDDKEEEE